MARNVFQKESVTPKQKALSCIRITSLHKCIVAVLFLCLLLTSLAACSSKPVLSGSYEIEHSFNTGTSYFIYTFQENGEYSYEGIGISGRRGSFITGTYAIDGDNITFSNQSNGEDDWTAPFEKKEKSILIGTTEYFLTENPHTASESNNSNSPSSPSATLPTPQSNAQFWSRMPAAISSDLRTISGVIAYMDEQDAPYTGVRVFIYMRENQRGWVEVTDSIKPANYNAYPVSQVDFDSQGNLLIQLAE